MARMNPKPGDVWRVLRGDVLVAELVVEGPDMPWFRGHARTTSAFEPLKPLFADVRRLVDQPDFDEPAWYAAVKRLWEQLQLVGADGRPVSEWALYIDGTEARWRWADSDQSAS
jgi:hypothetical protein